VKHTGSGGAWRGFLVWFLEIGELGVVVAVEGDEEVVGFEVWAIEVKVVVEHTENSLVVGIPVHERGFVAKGDGSGAPLVSASLWITTGGLADTTTRVVGTEEGLSHVTW